MAAYDTPDERLALIDEARLHAIECDRNEARLRREYSEARVAARNARADLRKTVDECAPAEAASMPLFGGEQSAPSPAPADEFPKEPETKVIHAEIPAPASWAEVGGVPAEADNLEAMDQATKASMDDGPDTPVAIGNMIATKGDVMEAMFPGSKYPTTQATKMPRKKQTKSAAQAAKGA